MIQWHLMCRRTVTGTMVDHAAFMVSTLWLGKGGKSGDLNEPL